MEPTIVGKGQDQEMRVGREEDAEETGREDGCAFINIVRNSIQNMKRYVFHKCLISV